MSPLFQAELLRPAPEGITRSRRPGVRRVGSLRSAALNRRRVDEDEIVLGAGALAGEQLDQPLDGRPEPAASLPVAGLLGQLGEQMAEALAGDGEEPGILGDPHDRLGDAEGDDLGIGDPAVGVIGLAGQEIVSHAINGDQECVEVSVHRGLLVDGEHLNTADFGLSSLNPLLKASEAAPRSRLLDMGAVELVI